MTTFVIAEAGSSHDGDFAKAAALIDMARYAGANACKFQYWSSAKRMATRRHAPALEAIYAKYQVPDTWLPNLKELCEAAGMEFMCSTFLPEDVGVVAPLVKTLKIASFEANDRVHLAAHVEHVHSGKHVIISCGVGAERGLISRHLIQHVQDGGTGTVRCLLCVSAYPTPVDQLHLARLHGDYWHEERIPYKGFSDHAPAYITLSGAFAVMAGAEIIERHIRLVETETDNPETPHAMLYQDFCTYVDQIRLAEKMLGSNHPGAEIEAERPMRAYRVR